MNWPIIMHINYCEQGQTLEEICRKAVSWGFDGVEFRRKRSGVAEGVEEYLDSLARAVELSGLKMVLFGGPGPDLMSSDEAKRNEEIEKAVDFYRLAHKRFELTVCNTMSGVLTNPDKTVASDNYDKHGSAVATEEHYKWASDGFKTLGELASELKFHFAFETHMNYLHDSPASTKKLINMINHPSVGANLDYENVICFTNPPSLEDSINELKDSLYYVHLKNLLIMPSGYFFSTALSDGQINHRQYLQMLKKLGYKGPICIETACSGDREGYAKPDLKYIKSLIHDIA